MKDNILQFPKLEIIDRNEPHEILNYYYKILEEALLHYDIEDHRVEQALVNLQQSISWWEFYCSEE